MYTSPLAQVHKFPLEKCVRPVKLRVSFFWCLLRALESSGLQGVQVEPSCVCMQRAPCTELPALILFSGSAQSFAQLLRAKWSPWEIIQLRQDVPEHPDSSSQAELRISAKRSWGMVEHGYPWRTWSKGHTSGGSEKDVKGKQVGEKEHVKQE